MSRWRSVLLPNISAGTVTAFVMLSFAASYGVIAFGDPILQPHVSVGFRVALITTWVLLLVNSAASSFTISLAGPDANSSVLLGLMAGSIAQVLAKNGADIGTIIGSVLGAFASVTVLVGLTMFLLGIFRQGRVIGFVPYPVIGGLLSGTGLLVFIGAIRVVIGQSGVGEAFFPPSTDQILSLGVMLAIALLMQTLPKKIKNPLVIPGIIIGFIVVIYALLLVMKIDLETARQHGFFLKLPLASASAAGDAGHPLAIDFAVIFDQWPSFLVMAAIVILSTMINLAGLDLAANGEGNYDRDLKGIGAALMLSGLLGGFLGHTSVNRSLVHKEAGANSRLGGIWAGVLCLVATYFFPSLIFYFPKPVLAGILLSIGMGLLKEWVLVSRTKLPLAEWLLVLLVGLIIAVKGPIYGVGLGILVTSVLFVYNYSHINFVRHQFTLGERMSSTDRPVQQLAALRSMGTRVLILELQGYLFFGTSTAIVTMARSKYEKGITRFFVFDFRMVQGIDASAVNSFVKLAKIFIRDGLRMVCTDMRPDIMLPFQQAGVGEKMGVYFRDDLDHGLEWIEEQLLAKEAEHQSEIYNAESIYAPQMSQRLFDLIQQKCETLELEPAQVLFRSGDPTDGVYFVEQGTLAVVIGLQEGQTKRLRTLGPGSLIGEMSLYTKQPRSADAVAVNACRVRRLSVEGFERIRHEDHELSNELHVYIVKLLSFRLGAANAQIAALA